MTSTSTPAAAETSAAPSAQRPRFPSQLSAKQCEVVLDSIASATCPRCTLRLLGSFNYEWYSLPDTAIIKKIELVTNEAGESIPYSFSSSQQKCAICINMLSDELLHSLPEAVISSLSTYKTSPTRVKKVKMATNVDPKVILREHFFKVYLNHKMKEKNVESKGFMEEDTMEFRRFFKRLVFEHVLAIKMAENKYTLSQQGENQEFISVIAFSIDDGTNKQPAATEASTTVAPELKEQQGEEGKNDSAFADKSKKRNLKRRRDEKSQDDKILMEKNYTKLHHQIQDTIFNTQKIQQSKMVYRVETNREPIYLCGYYNKYERGLSNTLLIIQGKKITDNSVDMFIGPVITPVFEAKGFTFVGAGREDIDVRMLGNGRPFALILEDAKADVTTETLKELEAKVNENQISVHIKDLKFTDKSILKKIEEAAEDKRKVYKCVIYSTRPIKSQTELDEKLNSKAQFDIFQKTPIRVCHRRNMDVRKRTIYSLKAERVSDHYFVLELDTQAGTYIKEFAHGDFGRTHPSLGTLLDSQTDILQLDVADVQTNI